MDVSNADTNKSNEVLLDTRPRGTVRSQLPTHSVEVADRVTTALDKQCDPTSAACQQETGSPGHPSIRFRADETLFVVSHKENTP
jgi:hypothetical protein